MNKRDSGHSVHILPLRVYLGIGALLLILTLITVAVSFVHLGPYNLVVAMAIASIKASLVALFFMHLLYDNKFYLSIFVASLLFLGVLITLTMFDTMRRDDIYPEVATPIKANAAMYDTMRPDSSAEHSTAPAAAPAPTH